MKIRYLFAFFLTAGSIESQSQDALISNSRSKIGALGTLNYF